MERQRTRKLRRSNRQRPERVGTGSGGRFEELVRRAPHLRSLLRAEPPDKPDADYDEEAILEEFQKDLAGD